MNAPQPSVFSVDKPARLVTGPARYTHESHRALSSRRHRQRRCHRPPASRAAVRAWSSNSARSAPYTVRVDGNKILLQIDGASAAARCQARKRCRRARQPSAGSITSVDFRRGEKGEGRVLVNLTDPKTVVDVKEEGGKVIARFRNTHLQPDLGKRLDVLDFATPAKFVDARRATAATA